MAHDVTGFAQRATMALACSLLSLTPVFAAELESARPNIILVMADDLDWGDVAYNGNKIVRTPHLDAMSRERR